MKQKKTLKSFTDRLHVLLIGFVATLAIFSMIAPLTITRAATANGDAICTNQTDLSKNLGTCVNRIYLISLSVGGVLAVLIFVIAGYMYISGGAAAKGAKTMMESAITGLIILFATFLILNTINPDLTTFSGLSLPNVTCGTGNNLCTAPTSNTLGSLGNTNLNPGSGSTSTATTTPGGSFIIDGYNLTGYSTTASFPSVVQSVFNSTVSKNLTGADAITAFMQAKAAALPSSVPVPITGQMVVNSANNYGVDANMLLTLMWVESGFGTTSQTDIRTHNPGSVGNTDNGSTIDDGTWQDGVDELAGYLSKHGS